MTQKIATTFYFQCSRELRDSQAGGRVGTEDRVYVIIDFSTSYDLLDNSFYGGNQVVLASLETLSRFHNCHILAFPTPKSNMFDR
jgi:hypothetical protein